MSREAAAARPLRAPRSRLRRRAGGAGLTLALWALVLLFFVPSLWLILTAIRPDVEINARPPVWIPHELTLHRFKELLGAGTSESSVPFGDYLRNSMIITSVSTVVSLVIGILAGYGFARLRFRGNRSLFFGLMLARAVPGIALSLPLFVLFVKIHLVDTRTGLVIAYAAFNVPFTTWLMDGFFREVPVDIEEAARMDGCSRWQAFRRVELPLVLPGVAASAIFAFLSVWNEFQLANVLARTTRSKTFPVGLFDFTTEFTSDFAGMCAMSVIMLLPAVLFVVWAQRHLVRGLTLGALK